MCMILSKHSWNIENKHFKVFEKEYENQLNDYRDEKIEEEEKYINEKLSNLRLHKIIKTNRINSFIMGV